MRAVLSENIVLGTFAGALGLGLAAMLLPVLRTILPPNFPRLHEIAFSWPAAVFALIAAIGTSAVAGMVATLRRTAADPNDALAEEARTASASGRTAQLRSLLVASEMALACVLCFAAVLLLRSSIELNNRDNGFKPAGTMTFELSFPARGYTNRDRLIAFYAEAARRIREIPGVQAAGFSTSVPWTGYDENTGFNIDGYTRKPGESLSARYQGADDGFVRAIGMRLVQGRDLSPADTFEAPKVIIVNDALARRYFPSGDAVGRVMNVFGAKRQIVGVVSDIHDQPADNEALPAFWMAMAQQPFRQARGIVRTTGDPLAIVPAVRAALQSIDRELPMADIRSMEEIAGVALSERHFALWLCEAFAGLAIALGAIGVYGLLSFSVEQRRREIGIRMALGASRRTVLGMIFNSGLLLSLAGTVAGLLMAPAAGRLLESLLYGVSATDRISLVLAPGIIILIALLGCIAPAWTAVRTDPTISLREQ
jgi:predicted permease